MPLPIANAYGFGPHATSATPATMHASDMETPASVYGLVETWAQTDGDRDALVERGHGISFRRLLSSADEVAESLRLGGLAPGDRVVLTLRNGVAFAVAMLAAWRVGAVIVPLHVQLREVEIARYAAECGATALITTSERSLVDSICREAPGIRQTFLLKSDGTLDERLGHPIQRLSGAAPTILGDEPAVTMFSTGSTGLARRVTRSHRDLVGEALSVAAVTGTRAEDRVLGVSPYFHAYGFINGLLSPLISGCQIFIAPDFFPSDIAALIAEKAITGFPGVPFMFQLLADLPKSFDFSSLRYVLSAGAPLPPAVADSFRARYGISIRQLYGSTETGVISIEPADADVGMSAGFPIPGVSVEILDDARRVVARGETGSVAVTSRFAAKAHDGDAADRESSFEGSRFFPGDIGTIRDDGSLLLLGRSRGFINVAGNKVDPTEIENVLKEMPAIAEAVVVGLPDGAAGEKLKAYLVANQACTRDEVYAFLRDRLADYKRPRLVEFRKELPRSPLGKILRKYLVEADRGPTLVFDPQVGFTARGDGLDTKSFPQLEALPPVLRTLLVTDGTVTRTLEAFFWEPIGVDVLLHTEERLAEASLDLDLPAGAAVVRRQVLLRGRYTTSIYAFAETLISSDALTSEFWEALVEGRKGIGELIREKHIETYRNLIDIDRLTGGAWAKALDIADDAKVARRRYTIRHQQNPVILISEVFPEARF